MLNFLKLPTVLDYQELDGAACYAFDLCFKDWTVPDFSELAALLKDQIGIDKYLELEDRLFRKNLLSLSLVPMKARKAQENSLTRHHALVRAYAYWRLVTGSLVVQNRLQELETVQTSSAKKAVDISLSFLIDLNFLLDSAPVWCERMPVPSPFLDQNGEETYYLDDLLE